MTTRPVAASGAAISLAYLAVGALVAAYLAARAILVPLTYDEAATLARYVERDVTAVFDFNVATNHFLNTVLTKISCGLLGDAPWALRLPNVVAGAVFLWATAAITRRSAHPFVGLAGFVLLACNPYLLDYLSLSRGYGLATALLAVSTLHLVRWLDLPVNGRDAHRALARCLWMGVAAVLANFTVLVAWLAMFAVILARILWSRPAGAAAAAATTEPSPIWTWRHAAVWLVLTAAFSVTVFSRQEVLSPDLFTPITVRITGLFDEELEQVRVSRETAKGRFRLLERAAGGVWRTGDNADAWGLRIELPVSLDRNLASLEVTIGPHRFRRDRRADGPWQVYDNGPDRVLRSTAALAAPRSGIETVGGAINWVGDARQWLTAAQYSSLACGLLLAIAGLWAATLASLRSLGGVTGVQARVLFWPPLALAGFVAAPLYLLRRDAQLYFGGRSSLVADTFGSLITGTAYGRSDAGVQLTVALIVLAALAALVLALIFAPRLRPALAIPATLAAVVALVASQVAAQHALLGTPYLTGRTALFLLPLVVLMVTTLADAVARAGLAPRAVATTAIALLAAAVTWQGLSSANTVRTLDWPDDAATPAMLGFVAHAVADGVPPAEVRIGVEWMFYPAARYYAARLGDGGTRYVVEVIPGDGPLPDFLYTQEGSRNAEGALVQAFPESTAALWRVRTGSIPPERVH